MVRGFTGDPSPQGPRNVFCGRLTAHPQPALARAIPRQICASGQGMDRQGRVSVAGAVLVHRHGFHRSAHPSGGRGRGPRCRLLWHPPESIDEFRSRYGVPQEWMPIGAIAVGHPDPDADPVKPAPSSDRKSLDELVHRGHW